MTVDDGYDHTYTEDIDDTTVLIWMVRINYPYECGKGFWLARLDLRYLVQVPPA